LRRTLTLENRRELLGEGQFLERLGIRPFRPVLEPLIGTVERGSPAAEAGLQAGDRVLSVDGEPVASWAEWVAAVQAAPEETLRVRVSRAGGSMELQVTPARVEMEGESMGRIGAGVDTDQPQIRAMSTLIRLGPVEGLANGAARTWEVSALTLRVLGRMITGEASVKNIAGPVTIAEFAGMTAIIGITAFLGFLALVSVSLGIINLLPIPVLDGGHLMFNLVEWIKGSAVSERTQLIGQQLGLVAIAGLMLLALYNDFTRLLG
jgi:regulator of sigma E protease